VHVHGTDIVNGLLHEPCMIDSSYTQALHNLPYTSTSIWSHCACVRNLTAVTLRHNYQDKSSAWRALTTPCAAQLLYWHCVGGDVGVAHATDCASVLHATQLSRLCERRAQSDHDSQSLNDRARGCHHSSAVTRRHSVGTCRPR
jgi:hypothetical protein